MVQKAVPPDYRNVGRFWGHSRDVKPVMQCETECTNDDLVGALEAGKWMWQTGDVVRYHTLYGAADALTKWQLDVKLVLSTSRNRHSKMTPHTRRDYHGHQATFDPGRRLRTNHASYIWNGGSDDPRPDADGRS